MKKKALSLVLALVMCLGLTFPAFAGGVSSLDSSQYSIVNGVAIIHEGVTHVYVDAFPEDVRQGISGIVFPSSLTEIGAGAFQHCDSLISVTIPCSVTSIGLSAFFGCKSLTDVTIENGVTSVRSNVFSACTSVLQKLKLYNGVKMLQFRSGIAGREMPVYALLYRVS